MALITSEYVYSGGIILLPESLCMSLFRYSERIDMILRLFRIIPEFNTGSVNIEVFIPIYYTGSKKDLDASLFMIINVSNSSPESGKLLGRSMSNFTEYLKGIKLPLEYESKSEAESTLPTDILSIFEEGVIPNLSVRYSNIIKSDDFNTPFQAVGVERKDIDRFINDINKKYRNDVTDQ